MTSEAQAQPRWMFSLFMIVLATSIPFVVSGVDPLMLSLNLPAITQDLGIPSDLVGFTKAHLQVSELPSYFPVR